MIRYVKEQMIGVFGSGYNNKLIMGDETYNIELTLEVYNKVQHQSQDDENEMYYDKIKSN